jgi:hypothetical protein
VRVCSRARVPVCLLMQVCDATSVVPQQQCHTESRAEKSSICPTCSRCAICCAAASSSISLLWCSSSRCFSSASVLCKRVVASSSSCLRTWTCEAKWLRCVGQKVIQWHAVLLVSKEAISLPARASGASRQAESAPCLSSGVKRGNLSSSSCIWSVKASRECAMSIKR